MRGEANQRTIEDMKHEALVGRMLFRCRRLTTMGPRGGGQVVLSVGKPMQLRQTPRNGECEREEQSPEERLTHARIIHRLSTPLVPAET